MSSIDGGLARCLLCDVVFRWSKGWTIQSELSLEQIQACFRPTVHTQNGIDIDLPRVPDMMMEFVPLRPPFPEHPVDRLQVAVLAPVRIQPVVVVFLAERWEHFPFERLHLEGCRLVPQCADVGFGGVDIRSDLWCIIVETVCGGRERGCPGVTLRS